jgi:DNA-binding SARP family transcriptional activator/Tfp pilus assembly protein PilF
MTVLGPDGPIVNAASQPKRLALLALLARAGERGITRDKALGYFWPDAEEDRARRSLANAVWALRRDLGSEDVFLPGNDLRLNPDVIEADVRAFESAVAAGDLSRAATLYEGPFLDGFRLVGAPEFDRWVEGERSALAHKYVGVVEKLARAAEANGRTDEAVDWWRRIVVQDPLNARLALGLMRALVAAGDRVSAVRHAQIYEALVEQELDLPPDRTVVDYARELRATLATVSSGRGDGATSDRGVWEAGREESTNQPAAMLPAPPPSEPPPGAVLDFADHAPAVRNNGVVDAASSESTASPIETTGSSPPAMRPAPRLRGRLTMFAVIGAVAVAAIAIVVSLRRGASRPAAVPVIALGQIADYRQDQSTQLVKPLTDMLATALARSPAVQVVSTARMYELANGNGLPGTSGMPDAYVRAARTAGATELLDGAVYALGDSTLRLDLRRIDLSTGNVRAAHSVVARDPFALADSGTARLLAAIGADAPAGSIADVTTRSLAAYRFYDEGVRAFYQDDLVSAERLFKAALAEDSTFASAAFYLARSYRQDDAANAFPMFERAVALASRISDRERLCIRAYWEERTSSTNLRTTAESLLVRYPQEVEGYFFTGIVRVADGDHLEAVPFLERAIAMDSLSLGGARAECTACEALTWLMTAYVLADSLHRAERVGRRWVQMQPRSGLGYMALIDVLMREGRIDEASAVLRERSRLAPGYEVGEDVVARLSIHGGDFARADELMRSVVATGTPARRMEANFILGLSARYQGRLSEALAYAKEEYRASREAKPAGTPPKGELSEAQILQEMGRSREAAALFESIAWWNPGTLPAPDVAPGMIGRHRAWSLTHAASALASVGDTATLAARADTIQRYGGRSLYRLHRELHHHVRALLLVARQRDDEAIAEFRQALVSPGSAYTRTNYELGRALLRRGRPAEAIAVIGPALRGGVEATSYYVTHTELHELLAQAWDSLGSAATGPQRSGVTRSAAIDSAVVHYGRVANAWRRGDPPFAERAARADARMKALGRPRLANSTISPT